MNFDEWLCRVEDLRKDRARGPEKPYKPLLLASVLVLIAKRKLLARQVFLDGGLKSVFKQLLARLYPDWEYRADPRYPFRHLENDGVWTLVAGNAAALDAARGAGAKAREVLRYVACAELPPDVFAALTRPAGWLRALTDICKHLPPRAIGRIAELAGEPSAPMPRVAARELITERALEEHLVAGWHLTPFARRGVRLATCERDGLPGRQVVTPVNAIDLLGFQRAARTWWVIELKRGRTSDAVVGQVSRYLGWLSESRRGKGEKAVGVVVARVADAKLVHAVRANDRLSLWLYDDHLNLKQA